MYLKSGRDLFRSVLILISAALAYWVDLKIGLALATFVGIMTFQSAFTDWCPIDLILMLMGMKKKSDAK